jgi:hypothetical protein
MKLLEQAKAFMMEDYELLKGSAGYLYDVVTIQQQVLSNKSLECYQEMIKALENQQAEAFDECAEQFLELIDEMEQVTAPNEHYRLDRWIKQAERLAEHADDFSRKMYVWNAKMLITTWGSYEQSEKGKLHDYSNRQWSGLIKEFYKPRWERWIEERRKELRSFRCDIAPQLAGHRIDISVEDLFEIGVSDSQPFRPHVRVVCRLGLEIEPLPHARHGKKHSAALASAMIPLLPFVRSTVRNMAVADDLRIFEAIFLLKNIDKIPDCIKLRKGNGLVVISYNLNPD